VELETAIAGVRDGRKTSPRTSRLLAEASREWYKSWPKKRRKSLSKRFVASAPVIYESVDLLYNLVVLWSEFGITGSEIWAEMDRRQALVGIAEKLPKEVGVGSTSSAEH
jgi:phosphoribosyl-ATP pyrophosphohydrolase